MKNAIYFLLAAALTLSTASLAQQSNPAGMLRDKKQAETLSSLKNLGDGKFYSMNYKADYKLQEFIDADIESQEMLRMMIAGTLMDISSVPVPAAAFKPACTAFKAVTPDGDVIYARNFDYPFTDSGSIMLRTAPKRGYKSISMVSSSFVGISGGAASPPQGLPAARRREAYGDDLGDDAHASGQGGHGRRGGKNARRLQFLRRRRAEG